MRAWNETMSIVPCGHIHYKVDISQFPYLENVYCSMIISFNIQLRGDIASIVVSFKQEWCFIVFGLCTDVTHWSEIVLSGCPWLYDFLWLRNVYSVYKDNQCKEAIHGFSATVTLYLELQPIVLCRYTGSFFIPKIIFPPLVQISLRRSIGSHENNFAF